MAGELRGGSGPLADTAGLDYLVSEGRGGFREEGAEQGGLGDDEGGQDGLVDRAGEQGELVGDGVGRGCLSITRGQGWPRQD